MRQAFSWKIACFCFFFCSLLQRISSEPTNVLVCLRVSQVASVMLLLTLFWMHFMDRRKVNGLVLCTTNSYAHVCINGMYNSPAFHCRLSRLSRESAFYNDTCPSRLHYTITYTVMYTVIELYKSSLRYRSAKRSLQLYRPGSRTPQKVSVHNAVTVRNRVHASHTSSRNSPFNNSGNVNVSLGMGTAYKNYGFNHVPCLCLVLL